MDDYNKIFFDNERTFPLFAKSGHGLIFFQYGESLLRETIVNLRRMLGIRTRSPSMLENLYLIFLQSLISMNTTHLDHTLLDFSSISSRQNAIKHSHSSLMNDINW